MLPSVLEHAKLKQIWRFDAQQVTARQIISQRIDLICGIQWWRDVTSCCAMRSSSAHTSTMRPEIFILPAYDEPTPNSKLRTIFRRLRSGFSRYLTSELSSTSFLLVWQQRKSTLTTSLSDMSFSISLPGACEAGPNRPIKACSGFNKTDNTGVREKQCEKLTIPMMNFLVKRFT